MKLLYKNSNLEDAGIINLALSQTRTSNTTIAQVVQYLYNAHRSTIAHTKDRGDVRGGGAKPWRQKGTGRARAGSSRSPLWRGGGITFGPLKTDTFATRLPRKMYKNALFTVLEDAIQANKLHLVENIVLSEQKTKQAAAWLAKVTSSPKTCLLVLDSESQLVLPAFRNLAGVNVVDVHATSLLHFMEAQNIIITKAALEQVIGQELSLPKKPTKKVEPEVIP